MVTFNFRGNVRVFQFRRRSILALAMEVSGNEELKIQLGRNVLTAGHQILKPV
jgi:hypothetical protein